MSTPQPSSENRPLDPAHEENCGHVQDNPPKKKSGGRILELDAIRALTCINLLLFHFTYVYEHKYGFNYELGFSFPYGKYGVQLFFMLSGLVNALTLLKKRKPGEFIANRCIRILPSYWLVIVLNLILFSTLSLYGRTVHVAETAANLTTLPNLFGYENMEPVTWTLQVEMLFYLLLMGGFALGLLDRPLRTMMGAICVCLISCAFIDWFKSEYPQSVWNGRLHVIEQLFLFRTLPLFSMGILLNEIRCERGKAWQLWIGILASGIVFHLVDLRDHNPLATVMMIGLLTACAYGKMPLLRFRPLIYISAISYPLYLFHNNLGTALMKAVESLGIYPIPAILIATAFSIALATAIARWFEKPVTGWLRKVFLSADRKTESKSKEPADSTNSNEKEGKVQNKDSRRPQEGEIVLDEQVSSSAPNAFDSSECLEDVIQAEQLTTEIRNGAKDKDACSPSSRRT